MAGIIARRKISNRGAFLVKYAGQIDYTQGPERWDIVNMTWKEAQARLKAGGRLTGDCSSVLTACFKWAGVKDPNGQGYRDGYTGTLLSGPCPHYTGPVSRAHQGAIGVYVNAAKPDGYHTFFVLKRNGNNPYLFSHGSEDGPLDIKLLSENTAHVGEEIVWLDVSKL